MIDQDNIFSVSEVNRHIRHILEGNIPNLFIEGEISNYKHHSSGHIYFSLKDEMSSIRCVFFRQNNQKLDFKPKNGDEIVCGGKISVFEKAGNYQINIQRMILSGKGKLQQKFELLKAKLLHEGLFESVHKKEIPSFPSKIGVVTSSTGAAIQDIRNVLTRRFPCRIFLYPAAVQGETAAKDIIRGIEYFNLHKSVDVIIIGRGGGSQEDLFCFNDEALARTIFASIIPIVSAVGHEIDYTISDFVADLRAPTPSAAAELVVPDKEEFLSRITSSWKHLCNQIRHYVVTNHHKFDILENKINQNHPKKKVESYQQLLDELQSKLLYHIKFSCLKKVQKIDLLEQVLQELSPYEIIKRGYSIIRSERKLLRSVEHFSDGQNLEFILKDGSVSCQIDKVEKQKK